MKREGSRERLSNEVRVGGREEAAGPGPEGLRALLWRCQHSGTRKREDDEGKRGRAGELISSTHAHRAALRVPRDSPGIPHNIPSPDPPRTLGAHPPKPPRRASSLPPRSLRVATVPTGYRTFQFPGEERQDQDRARWD